MIIKRMGLGVMNGMCISSNNKYKKYGYGGDAVEFITAFGKEFNVDVSKFMIGEYFRPDRLSS